MSVRKQFLFSICPEVGKGKSVQTFARTLQLRREARLEAEPGTAVYFV